MNVETHLPLPALVAVLQGGDCRVASARAAPLVRRCLGITVSRCERLVASAGGNLGVEGADIAMEAWERVLRKLAAGSLVVTDESHFERLLMRVAKHCFLDHLSRKRRYPLPTPVADPGQAGLGKTEPVAPESAEGDLLLGAGCERLRWVERLFSWDDDQWASLDPRPLRRAPRAYRALVLFHLGEMARAEGDGPGASLVHRHAQLLGVCDKIWEPVSRAAAEPGGDENTLLAAVNRVCQTSIPDRAALSVLRYEFARAIASGQAGAGNAPSVPAMAAARGIHR